MSEATTQSKVDYFNLPRPLWRKLKKHLPKKRNNSKKQGGRPRVSDRASANAMCGTCSVDGMPMEGCAPRVVRSLLQCYPRAFPELEADGHLREADEVDGQLLCQRACRDRLEVASDGFQALCSPFGRPENREKSHRQGQARGEDEPSGGWARSSHLGRALRSQPPRQSVGHRSDRFDDTQASSSQGATPVRRESLGLLRLEGIRCLRGLHRSHRDQSQEQRCRRRGAGASAYRGVCREGLSGQEVESRAHDFMVGQATQPLYSLVEEGRNLAGTRSACLRSHLAQSGCFRIESKSWPLNEATE